MAPAPTPRHVAIVGNAPGMTHQGAVIDGADWVLRFNNAPGFGGAAGRRVTHLALLNHGGQMREWLEDPNFVARPVVRGAEAFLFPFGRKPRTDAVPDEDGRCWTDEASAMLAPLGRPLSILSEETRRDAGAILREAAGPEPVPSTGFLVALHWLRSLPATVEIGVHGFGFAGWEGHAFERERAWFEAMAARGRLRLHPLDARPPA